MAEHPNSGLNMASSSGTDPVTDPRSTASSQIGVVMNSMAIDDNSSGDFDLSESPQKEDKPRANVRQRVG